MAIQEALIRENHQSLISYIAYPSLAVNAQYIKFQ
jgi:hypothetical protein